MSGDEFEAGGVAGFLGAAARVFSPAAGSFGVLGATDGDPSVAAAGVPVFDGAAAGGFTVPEGLAEFCAPVPAGEPGVVGVAAVPAAAAPAESDDPGFGRGGGAACGCSLGLPTFRSPVVVEAGAAG